MLVDLRDRDNHRHARRLHMVDGLNRLWLRTVVSRDNDHDNVRHVRTAGTHFGKGFVARRIEEGDLRLVLHRQLIGADVLGDAAGFASNHVCSAQCIQQGGLAVIDMTHDRDNRRACLQSFGRIDILIVDNVDIGIGHAGDVVAKFGDQQFRRILIDRLRQGDGHAHLEQRLHKVGTALCHAVGKFLHGNGLRNADIAYLLDCRATLHVAALFLFASALQRRKRTSTGTFAIVERSAHGQLARLTPVIDATATCRTLRFAARR